MTPVPTVSRPATAHGWLRRSDLDGKNYDAWEMPDGTMKAVPRGTCPMIVTLQVSPLSLLKTGMDRSEECPS